MILKQSIAHEIVLLLICAIGFLFAPQYAQADPRVYVEQNIDFGTAFAFKDYIVIQLDATDPDPENAEVTSVDNTCHASGGHVGKLLFTGYGGVDIQVEFPDEIPLKDYQGTTVGYLKNMNKYSTRNPVTVDGDLISYVGGTLSTSTDIRRAYGSISVSIITN